MYFFQYFINTTKKYYYRNRPSGLLFFVPGLLFALLTPLFSPSSVSLSYFILAVPMCEYLGKRSCMSSPFHIATLNGTFFREITWSIWSKSMEKIYCQKLTIIAISKFARIRVVVFFYSIFALWCLPAIFLNTTLKLCSRFVWTLPTVKINSNRVSRITSIGYRF